MAGSKPSANDARGKIGIPSSATARSGHVWEDERAALTSFTGPFDGFHTVEATASATCLVSFDRNRYSVMARGPRGGRCKSLVYADRIVIRSAGELVAEHSRLFGRDRTIYDPWHYLPVLAKKPGAPCNGAPFQDWVLPPGLDRFRRKLGRGDPTPRAKRVGTPVTKPTGACVARARHGAHGRPGSVEAAVAEALEAGTASDDVVLNVLARHREPPQPPTLSVSDVLALVHAPIADCARLTTSCGARMQRHEMIAAMGGLSLKGMATHPMRKRMGTPGVPSTRRSPPASSATAP